MHAPDDHPAYAARGRRLVAEAVADQGLDLHGLRVFTEVGSGGYLFTPLLCLRAGAERVTAVARDSRWGSAATLGAKLEAMAAREGLSSRLSVVRERLDPALSEADIVMNAGAVRPIDRVMVERLKPTAVIPLLWETWEYRPAELDIEACRERGILVMGTDETRIGVEYPGLISLKMLLSLGIEVSRCRILVVSFGRIAAAHVKVLEGVGATVRVISGDEVEGAGGFADREALWSWLAGADAIVCDDRKNRLPILAEGGMIDPARLARINPGVVIAYRDGIIDGEQCRRHGLLLFPDESTRGGYPTFAGNSLGLRPVIRLNAVGLKVAETMARARLRGLSPGQAARWTVEHAPAQDFMEDMAWIT
jgi:hypothetical protein